MGAQVNGPQLRLLVGVDLTERSRNAFSRALVLAGAGGGSLTLLHVTSAELPQKLVAAHDSFATDVLEEHTLRARAEGVGSIAKVIAHGRDYEMIIEQARKDDSDLIILGTHRPSSVLQDMLGTTVDRVLRLGGIPLLLARRKAEHAYASIVVAIDFSPASRRALEKVLRWFPQARITAVTAYGSPRRSLLTNDDAARESVAETQRLALKGFLAEIVQSLGPGHAADVSRVVPLVQHGWAEDVILRTVEESKPDLVVIGTHARGGLEHAVLGSVAEWVLTEAPCDVLAVPPPK